MWVGSSLLPSQPGTQAPQYVYYCYFTTDLQIFSIVEETHFSPNTNRDGQNFYLNLQLWAAR